MRAFILALVLVLGLLPGAALADMRDRVTLPPTARLTPVCMAEAAQKHGLPLAALVGILEAEGGKEGEAVSNKNGTWDLGPMQINTVHLDDLLRLGFEPEAILRDGCVNAQAAAWLLRREYARTGDIWEAIGAYHSRTPRFHNAYIEKVRGHLARLGRSGSFDSAKHGGRGQ
jgi:hypothetical protein